MARVDPGGGMWPVVLSKLSSVLLIALLIAGTGAPWRLTRLQTAVALASGTVGTAAIVCYLLATREQLLAVATVLTSLYPAIPVVLALIVLRERLSGWQTTGLLAAAAAASLVTV